MLSTPEQPFGSAGGFGGAPTASGIQSPATNQPSPGPSTMTDNDVIQLVTAGLSEQVVATSIRQAPAKNFDLTPTGLIALKKARVSDAVIVVMQEKLESSFSFLQNVLHHRGPTLL